MKVQSRRRSWERVDYRSAGVLEREGEEGYKPPGEFSTHTTSAGCNHNEKKGIGYLRLGSRWTIWSEIRNFKPYVGVLSTTKTHSQGIMSLIKDSSY